MKTMCEECKQCKKTISTLILVRKIWGIKKSKKKPAKTWQAH